MIALLDGVFVSWPKVAAAGNFNSRAARHSFSDNVCTVPTVLICHKLVYCSRAFALLHNKTSAD